jgi:hypothetical protein
VIVSGLRDLRTGERAKLLLSVIPRANDLSLLCDVVRMAAGDVRSDGAEEHEEKLGLGADKDDVRMALIEKVRAVAISGEIWDQAKPEELLWFWWGSDFGEEVRTCTAAALANETWTPALLNSMISEVRSTAGDYERVNRDSYSKIADLNLATTRARELQNHAAAPVRAVAERFLNAIQNDIERPSKTR